MLKEEAIDILFGCIEAHSEEENEALDMAIEALKREQPDEWCTDCKEYDTEKKCCPRFNRVIRGAMKRIPHDDGTLEVKVEDATKIGRVLISDDEHRGGLYYPDEDEPQGDLISRAEAIDALRYAQHRFTVADEAGGMGSVKWSENVIYFAAAERVLTELPSADRPRDEFDGMIFSTDKYMAFIDKKDIHIMRKGTHKITVERMFNTEGDEYKPMPNHDRDWIVGCIKHDGFVKTDRGDKANQIILDALSADNTSTNTSTKSTNISTDTSADRPRGEWIEETSWKYKKGGRNSDMKEVLGTEWMTMTRQRCSECNMVTMVDDSILYKYCPHCGAEMRSE